MQAILIILGIYLLYNFIVNFIIPIYKATKRVQAQFRDVQDHASKQNQATQNSFTASSANSPGYNSKPSKKDYIDFEEIKD